MNNPKLIIDDQIVEVTPERVAELFASLNSGQQAAFFNHVHKVASNWKQGGFPIQLQWITDDDGLTLGGRSVMQQIGDYSHWGLRATT